MSLFVVKLKNIMGGIKMKDSVKDSMKDSWTFIGLVALSILYLFEVDVTRLTWLNGAAFVIIAVTLVPLLISIIRKITAFVKRRKEKKAAKRALEESN